MLPRSCALHLRFGPSIEILIDRIAFSRGREESPKLLYLGMAALRSRLAAVSRASPLMVMPPFASLRADPKSLGPRKGKVVFGYGLWMDLIIGMTLLES